MQRATRLVCVGRDEDAEEGLRRQISELGLGRPGEPGG